MNLPLLWVIQTSLQLYLPLFSSNLSFIHHHRWSSIADTAIPPSLSSVFSSGCSCLLHSPPCCLLTVLAFFGLLSFNSLACPIYFNFFHPSMTSEQTFWSLLSIKLSTFHFFHPSIQLSHLFFKSSYICHNIFHHTSSLSLLERLFEVIWVCLSSISRLILLHSLPVHHSITLSLHHVSTVWYKSCFIFRLCTAPSFTYRQMLWSMLLLPHRWKAVKKKYHKYLTATNKAIYYNTSPQDETVHGARSERILRGKHMHRNTHSHTHTQKPCQTSISQPRISLFMQQSPVKSNLHRSLWLTGCPLFHFKVKNFINLEQNWQNGREEKHSWGNNLIPPQLVLI